ncbi:MAG: ABC transporter ATP-binding protein, partial [Pseudomonadota bacterium]
MMRLEVQCLSLRIGGQNICDDLTLNVKPGEVWSVLGRNGVGKTTLLHTLAGLRDPVGGQIKLDGVALNSLAIKTRGQKVSILFQQAQAPIS